jgi:uncharacterized membrane protein YcaP (DUF421 family)
VRLYEIAARVALGYAFLLLLMRLSGRRTISDATPLHFVLALMLGELFDDLAWGTVSAAKFVTAAGTVVVAHLLATAASLHSTIAYRIMSGKAEVFVKAGKFQHEAMRRERLSLRETREMLRLHGIDPERELSAVEFAAIEVDGEPSLLRRLEDRPADRRDLELGESS